MKSNRSQLVLARACIALAVLLGVVHFATPALAETPAVSGADQFLVSDSSTEGGSLTSVQVLTVTGKAGDTVYINMKRGGETIASHLPFTLTDEDGTVDENGDVVGVATVEFGAQAFSYDQQYTIEVFADRNEKEKLYTGTVSTIYATYGDKSVPMVVRTLSEGEDRPLTIPQTQVYNNVTYELASEEAQVNDGIVSYSYKTAKDIADSIDAHVTYLDAENPDGDAIKVETITLANGTSQMVPVESIIASDTDESLYRTLQLTGSVTVAYPGTTEYTIMCKKLSSEWGKTGSFFTAYIRFVDADGNVLMARDKVVVNKTYNYTAPSVLYINDDGTVKEYQLQDKTKAKVKLEPGMAEGSAEYDIVYEPVADDAERKWTVVLENGTVSPDDSAREIKRVTYSGKPGESVTHTTDAKITVDGEEFVPTAAAKETYEHTFGVADMGVEQVIYYVSADYVPPEAYDVTVNYVNIATNETITSETYTASPSMRSDLEIKSPETFSMGGVDWIRLNGQEDPIRHSFYAAARTYVVYYRDVNDDLHASTVVRTVRVVYVDEEGNTVSRPTTVVDNGTRDNGTTDNGTTDNGTTDNGATYTTTTTNEGETPENGQAANAGQDQGENGTETGLATGQDLKSVEGENGDALVTEDGTDTATTRIEDDETPLANLSGDQAAGAANNQAVAIGSGIAAAIAAIGLIVFFVLKRRKQDADEASNDDVSAQ